MAIDSTGRARLRATPSRRAAVTRAEAHLRAGGGPWRVARLCRLVGLSERAFRNAVVSVHGVGPAQWMRAMRLNAARRALLAGGHAPPTVTAVATAQGFYELGRFAGLYKATFGEHPSQTLRQRDAAGGLAGRCG